VAAIGYRGIRCQVTALTTEMSIELLVGVRGNKLNRLLEGPRDGKWKGWESRDSTAPQAEAATYQDQLLKIEVVGHNCEARDQSELRLLTTTLRQHGGEGDDDTIPDGLIRRGK
jgi:hypothetical protein